MSQTTLHDAIAHMSSTKTELSRRAGVSRTTALAVSDDPSRARVDTLRELALALGYDISIALEPASDPFAAAAARVVLGDLHVDRHTEQAHEIEAWLHRLNRYSTGEPIDIVAEAARVSGAHHRRGSVMLTGRVDADRLVSAGRSSEARWALSGSAALEALGAEPGAVVVLWTDDPQRVTRLFDDTHRRVRTLTAATIVVAPAHPTVFEGLTTVEDVNLVSPVQGVIDAFANGGRDREIAESLVRSW
jgi:hypothetical protein